MFMFANYALLGGGIRVSEHSKIKRRSKALLRKSLMALPSFDSSVGITTDDL